MTLSGRDPAGIPARAIGILTATWDELATIGAELSESAWKQPTELPGWTVQDVLSHIIGTESFLQGLPAAERCRDAGDHVRNPIGELNENEVAARRAMRGAAVLAEWNDVRSQRAHTLAHGDAEYFAQPMSTPTGPGTMTDFLELRILDCWIHEQDIRRTVGIPGNLGGAAAEHTVDRLIRTIPMVIGKRAACPEGRAVGVRIVGDVERHLMCEVRNGRAGFVEEPSSAPICAIEMDTDMFVVLATGRQDPAGLLDRIGIFADDAAGIELGRLAVTRLNMMI